MDQRQLFLLITAWAAFFTMTMASSVVVAQNTMAEDAISVWESPRTPWGDPDIEGIWRYEATIPLERPEGVGHKDGQVGRPGSQENQCGEWSYLYVCRSRVFESSFLRSPSNAYSARTVRCSRWSFSSVDEAPSAIPLARGCRWNEERGPHIRCAVFPSGLRQPLARCGHKFVRRLPPRGRICARAAKSCRRPIAQQTLRAPETYSPRRRVRSLRRT